AQDGRCCRGGSPAAPPCGVTWEKRMTEPTHSEQADQTPAGRSPSAPRPRRLPVAVTVVLAVLMSLVPVVALEAIGASPAGADAICPCSLWSNATTPVIADFDDAQAVELGVQFSS